MKFNDWINIAPVSMATDAHLEEVDQDMKGELASQIQDRVRNQIDPGIDLRSARRVHSVRSVAEGGRIVISERKDVGAPQDGEAKQGGIEDLFTISSGIPKVMGNQLVFNSIKESELFVHKTQEDQDLSVEHVVTETIRMGLVDAHTKAVQDVENRYPQEKVK
jgi:hypothetical protein